MYNLLLVDDNKFEREGIIYTLKTVNIPVNIVEAEDGYQALELLKKQHFDILISDIKMPLLNGVDLIKRVRDFDQQIHIIIISGYNDFEYAKNLLSSNVTNYLLKPINTTEFIHTIKQLPLFCPSKSAEYSLVIRNILTIIETEYAQNLTLEALADRVFLSPSYLSNLFKKEVNQNIIPYLNDYRLKKASNLLRHSTMKINDIATFVGIPNVSYFNRLFKTKFDMSPTHYRKLHTTK